MKLATFVPFCFAVALVLEAASLATAGVVTVTKLDGNAATPSVMDPLVSTATFSAVGATGSGNINGPSVIRVPDWIPTSQRINPNANYYMYFANHSGQEIRLAWAQTITGPWTLFNMGSAPDRAWGTGSNNGTQTPGIGVLDINLDDYAGTTLDAPDTGRINIDGPAVNKYQALSEIASPNVFVDNVNQRIVMYWQADGGGSSKGQNETDSQGRTLPNQHTYVATSKYGLNFNQASQADPADPTHSGTRSAILGQFYFSVFNVDSVVNGQQVEQSYAFSNRGFLFKAPTFTAAGNPATIANGDELGGLWNPTTHNIGYYWWDTIPQNQNPLHGINISPDIAAHTRDLGQGNTRNFGEFTNDETPRHFTYYQPPTDPDLIYVFYSSRGDKPESIVMARLSLKDANGQSLTGDARLNPANWRRLDNTEQMILTSQYDWEGSDQPLAYSQNGEQVNVHQVRDPAIFVDNDGRVYLFYTGEGEEAIGVASLSFVSIIAGDANNDGIVDGKDMVAVEKHFGTTGTSDGLLVGDANDDGRVDGTDLLYVERHFGESAANAQATPEPASSTLLLVGAGLLAARRRAS